MDVVSGDLEVDSARTHNIEAWFPGQQEFRLIASSTNTTDYIARALGARYNTQQQQTQQEKQEYVHMLRATLCTTARTLCALLENHQTDEGIILPAVLRPYIGGRTFLPFVQNLGRSAGLVARDTQEDEVVLVHRGDINNNNYFRGINTNVINSNNNKGEEMLKLYGYK